MKIKFIKELKGHGYASEPGWAGMPPVYAYYVRMKVAGHKAGLGFYTSLRLCKGAGTLFNNRWLWIHLWGRNCNYKTGRTSIRLGWAMFEWQRPETINRKP
jgi:hypothetical protein